MAQKKTDIEITPETKIGALLDHYPQLEDVLIKMSPAFEKLRNPVLRRTVAKVASLRQVAKIGNLPVAELINRLRTEVGQKEVQIASEAGQDAAVKPTWVRQDEVEKTLDARPLIEGDGNPLPIVLKDLKDLAKGKVYLLITPFYPAPLIDSVKKKGYQVWSEDEDGVFRSYLRES